MNENSSNTIQIRAYSSDGYEIVICMAGAVVADIAKKLGEVRAAGYLAFQPEPAGEERQAIASVMRHVTDSGTPVLAAYPRWQREGRYGEYKFASIYMDSPDNIHQFEAQSGLKLNDIPLSDGEVGVRRKFGKTYPKEVAVKRAFDMIRIPDGTSDDGKARYRYEYAARLPIPAADPNAWTADNVSKWAEKWLAKDLTEAQLFKALGITSLYREFKGTVAEADKAVEAFIEISKFDPPARSKAAAAPLPKIECPLHLLEEGDIIYQCTKDDHGPVVTTYEVMHNWGKVGREFKLILKNLKTEKTDTVYWTIDPDLCAGPKVDAYNKNPSLCGKAKIGGYPQWLGQFAATG